LIAICAWLVPEIYRTLEHVLLDRGRNIALGGE